MHYRVTLADALTAHDEALKFGGRDDIGSLHLIQSALSRPYSGYHRSISRKAAALLHSMVNNHRFTDANKRTAWLLVELLIDRSGYRLDLPDDAPIDDLVVMVADGNIGYDDLVIWFGTHLERP